MVAAPPALLRWFHSSYPTLTFDPEWLDACLDYLTTNFPNTPTPALIKQVESQLLASDLATSTSPSQHFPSPLPETPTLLFPTTKASVLLQITSLDEIGHPALGQLDTLKGKREARKSELAPVQREKKDEEEEELEGVYPRGMMRLGLSSGHEDIQGIEWQRVQGLGLEECKLGAKILVHDVRMVRGILLLGPKSVVVKGNMVEEFEELAEAQLEARLRERLKMPPLPPPVAGAAHADDDRNAAAPPPQQPIARERSPLPDEEFDIKPVPAPAIRRNVAPPPPPQQRIAAQNPIPPPPARKPMPIPVAAPLPPPPPKRQAIKPPSSEPDDLFDFDDDAQAELDRLEMEALAAASAKQQTQTQIQPSSSGKRRKLDLSPSLAAAAAAASPLNVEDEYGMEFDDSLDLEGLDFDMVEDQVAPPERSAVLHVVKREERGKGREAPWGRLEKPIVEKKVMKVLDLSDSDEDQEEERKPVVKVGKVAEKKRVGVGGSGKRKGSESSGSDCIVLD